MMLLDEPTNHLDIEAIDSLAEAIKNFKVRGRNTACVAETRMSLKETCGYRLRASCMLLR
jgi:ABC-type multidrug transport system ATPase subunit